MLKADGFDKAFLGMCHRAGQEPVVAYDYHKCIAVLVEDENMTYDEAVEYLWFNTIGSWMGEHTPVFIHVMENIEDLTDEEHGN